MTAYPLIPIISGLSIQGEEESLPGVPPSPRIDHIEKIHGIPMNDPYRWLEDRENPETEKWIAHQNTYSRSHLDRLPHRREIESQLSSLIRTDQWGLPIAGGSRLFYLFRGKDQEQYVIRCRFADGTEKTLVEPPAGDTRTGIVDVSKDGSLLAYYRRTGGRDQMEICFLKVDTGELLPHRLPHDRYYGISLTPDNRGVYYACNHNSQGRVCYHNLHESSWQDLEIFNAGPAEEKIVISQLTGCGDKLIITVMHGAGGKKSEIFLLDTRQKSPLRTVVSGPESRFIAADGGEWLFIHTDMDAPRGRVMRTPIDNPDMKNWQEIIPMGDGVIVDITVAAGHVFVRYLENVRYRLLVFDAHGIRVGQVTMPHPGTISPPSGQWHDPEVYYHFSSYVTPDTIFEYDPAEDRSRLWSSPNISINPQDYVLRQDWFASSDGTQIPMYILHGREYKPGVASPTLLTGYGGFGLCRTPEYMPMAVLWANMGGVVALPALRGGGEFGLEWHEAGMRENKQKVFNDFTEAARYLIKKGYTSPEKLAISGRSNGGLLVGAAITQNPELFRCVICGYPLLDMLRYHKFLVGMYWVPEYGNPDDAGDFEYIRKYSPYHNTRPGEKYPAVLIITGDGDTRVDPLHARKMTALLQSQSGSQLPIMLIHDTTQGHVGGKTAGNMIQDLTDQLSFLMWQLDVKPTAGESFL